MFERAVRVELVNVMTNAFAFNGQKPIHCVTELRVCQPVCAGAGHG